MNITLSECARILGTSLNGGDAEFTSVSTDTRSLSPGALFIALPGPNYNGSDYVLAAKQAGAVGAIVSEEISLQDFPYITVPDAKRALQQIAQYQRQKSKAMFVAITGSCGKTTVRAMLEEILKVHGQPYLASSKSYNNEIGVPLTLCRLQDDAAYVALELGANHAGEIAALSHLAAPNVATILNASPAHLQGFGDLDGVACAKAEIFQGLREDGCAVLNADDHYYDFWKKQLNADCHIITFGIDHTADVYATGIKLDSQFRANFRLHGYSHSAEVRLSFLGEHNVMNALAAAALALALRIPFATICAGLENASAESRRLNRCTLPSGAVLIDDTYNSNPQAMAAAIDLLAQSAERTLLVISDMGELGENAVRYHQQVGEQARAHGIKKLYAVGDLAKHAAESFAAGGRYFANQAALIVALQADLRPQDVVLVKGSRAMQLETVVEALKENG